MTTLVESARAVADVKYRGLIAALVALALSFGCRGGANNFLTDLDEARRLASDLRVQFNKAVDASNRAVMADTDEASARFARDAEATKRSVESDLSKLSAVLGRLGYPAEIRSIDEFRRHFAEYDKVDRAMLALAVENTNLEAQRLFAGPGREAADGFRAALESVPATVAPKDRCRVGALVATAVVAVRELQVLQGPHIAESNDAAMTSLEKQMADSEASARAALKELGGIVEVGPGSPFATASAALDRFSGINAEIVKLSRRNTNVRSLDLALRAKPPLTHACDDGSRALIDALAKVGSKATR